MEDCKSESSCEVLDWYPTPTMEYVTTLQKRIEMLESKLESLAVTTSKIEKDVRLMTTLNEDVITEIRKEEPKTPMRRPAGILIPGKRKK